MTENASTTDDADLRHFAKKIGVSLDSLTDQAKQVLKDGIANGQSYRTLRAKMGGLARAAALTPERRREIARKAVAARIAKSSQPERSQAAKAASGAATQARRQRAKEKRLRGIKKPTTNQTPPESV